MQDNTKCVQTDMQRLMRWAEPAPEVGTAVYRLTRGPLEHKHTYHIFCPWSPDGSLLLLARYDRAHPEAGICVMDTADGTLREVGRSLSWESHTMAFQQWQGARQRVLYKDRRQGQQFMVTCNPDGSDVRHFDFKDGNAYFCGPQGRYVYGATHIRAMFPGDDIASRHDKGLLRFDLDTGERRVLMSVDEAVELLPDPAAVRDCHLYVKMVIVHPRLPRIMFNLTNTFWDRGAGEPRERNLITVGTDGSDPLYVGPCIHHPNWHSVENRIVANLHDFTGAMRLGLYPGDGRGLLEYVPRTRGSGHPSFSPDGRWLCTDAAGDDADQLILCDPFTGHACVAASGRCFSDGYPTFKAVQERADNETVMQALERAWSGELKMWQTQSHPSWSRDGSAVLFNRDIGQGSQVYCLDVARALAPLLTDCKSAS